MNGPASTLVTSQLKMSWGTPRWAAYTTSWIALACLLWACADGRRMSATPEDPSLKSVIGAKGTGSGLTVDRFPYEPVSETTRIWVGGRTESDDQVPLGGHYLAPLGDDSNPGTIIRPWKTLQHAIEQLTPGDVLYVRGGTYFESQITVSVSGTPTEPITIRNYPGESPVVDGGFREFRTAGNSDWETFDSLNRIYRSVKRYPGAGPVHGYFGPEDGSFRLVPYEDFGPLSTNMEDYRDTYPYYYIGPGLFWSSGDQKIYVRLKHSKYQAPMGFNVPENTDPRQTALNIFPRGQVLDFASSAAHILVQGIDFRYRDNAVHFDSGSHHITLRDCEVLGGRYHILCRDVHHLIFDGITVRDTTPPWVARSDVKFPSPGRPGHLFQGSGISLDTEVDHIEIMNSTFLGLFDAIGAGGAPHNVRIHHNLFDGIRDDVFQLGTAGYEIEFDHNVIVNAAAGPSWHGSGKPPSGKIGTKYFHHNIIDCSTPQLYGRTDPQNLLGSKHQGPKGDGMASGRAFGSHAMSNLTGPDPWKIYHNTIVVMEDVDASPAGQTYVWNHSNPAFPHEVYNNIIINVGESNTYRVAVGRGARVADGSQIHDGNLYSRPSARSGTPIFLEYQMGNSKASFNSLADFKSSSYWAATKAYYPPGWEASGIEADPKLDGSYSPSSNGPAASGAIDLSGKHWPGLVGETFRGAIPPH